MPLPVAQLVFVVGIVEREHGRGMPDFYKTLARPAPYPLSGRIGSDEGGIVRFQFLQFVHELIELGVGDLRVVENVVEILVVADFLAQRLNLLYEVPSCGSHSQTDYIREAW
jgi:hypothetical protein